MNTNEFYINRCLQLAKNGLGTTYPNPMVGCVIVHKNKIIGEGWHRKAGEPHAEVLAIASVKNKLLLQKSTIYVSLEPCSHFGKTPPCCDLIIAYNIPNVVIGTIDPFAKVAGRGVKNLKNAGKNVTVGVLEKECLELNKRFFTYHTKKRPFIILKWAKTLDEFIAPESKKEKKPIWITSNYSRQLVHKWRSEEQAILAGTNTVMEDNPTLNVRDWTGNNPVRIILDKNNRISKNLHIFDNKQNTIILNKELLFFSDNLASEIASYLYKKEIQSVIIEGGKQTLETFIQANLWDEARIFTGNTQFFNGIKAPNIRGKIVRQDVIENNQLLIYSNYD